MSKISITIIIINLALLGAQFWLTSVYSASGKELNEVLSQISELNTQNNQLQLAIWGKSSLASIQQSASNLRLVQTTPTILAPLTTALVP